MLKRGFLKRPNKGLYPAYVGEIWTDMDSLFVQTNHFKKITFPYCKLGYFPLSYKSAVPYLKIQAKNSIFWILVYMIAIHHCAKEQFAWLNGVQMVAPYCEMQQIYDFTSAQRWNRHETFSKPWNVKKFLTKQ